MGKLSLVAKLMKIMANVYIENAKAAFIEKLTRLFVAVFLAFLFTILAVIAVTAITFGIASELLCTIAPIWVYLMVSGFYFVLILVIYLLRRPLIVKPIDRFLDRLIFGKRNIR